MRGAGGLCSAADGGLINSCELAEGRLSALDSAVLGTTKRCGWVRRPTTPSTIAISTRIPATRYRTTEDSISAARGRDDVPSSESASEPELSSTSRPAAL